jgi:hypothetical protein
MKRLVITFLSMLALAVVALPAAATSKEPLGPAFSLLTGHPTTFAAATPFHIANCWNIASTSDAIGKFSISLDVDATPRAEDFTEFSVRSGDPDILNRCWVWNFPDGVSTGTHTFVEHWFAPCYVAVSQFGYPGACSNPNAVVEALTRSLTVNFT